MVFSRLLSSGLASRSDHALGHGLPNPFRAATRIRSVPRRRQPPCVLPEGWKRSLGVPWLMERLPAWRQFVSQSPSFQLSWSAFISRSRLTITGSAASKSGGRLPPSQPRG